MATEQPSWWPLFGYMPDGRRVEELSEAEKIDLDVERPTARTWVPLLLSPTAMNRSEIPRHPDDEDTSGSEEDQATRIVAKELGSKAKIIVASMFKGFTGSGVKSTLARDQLRGHLAIQEGITDIQMQAFMFAQEITSITLPNSLLTVEEQAFYGCQKLLAVHIPDSVKIIRSKAFYNTSLKIVSVPATTILSDLSGPVFPEKCKVVLRVPAISAATTTPVVPTAAAAAADGDSA